jgi:hypothetical protein
MQDDGDTGTYTYSIEEPLRQVRTQVAPNDHGLSLDQRLTG